MNIFKKLFSRSKDGKKNSSLDVPTLPIPKQETEETPAPVVTRAAEHSFSPLFTVGCSQSVGVTRDNNEDAIFTLTTNLATDQTYLPLGLYIVADGMGGHQQGEIASAIAVRVLGGQILRKVLAAYLSPRPEPPADSLQEIIQEGIQEAHLAILKYASGSGTTITGMLLLNEQMTIVHVGDSRAYSVTPEGQMTVLTRDHSLVMRMIELGHLSNEEAAVHPQRNVLYRALGQGDPFSPDIGTYPIPQAGHLVICSDGLWGVVPEKRFSEIILSASDPQSACEQLIDAANQAGGPDNISVILIRLPDSVSK